MQGRKAKYKPEKFPYLIEVVLEGPTHSLVL